MKPDRRVLGYILDGPPPLSVAKHHGGDGGRGLSRGRGQPPDGHGLEVVSIAIHSRDRFEQESPSTQRGEIRAGGIGQRRVEAAPVLAATPRSLLEVVQREFVAIEPRPDSPSLAPFAVRGYRGDTFAFARCRPRCVRRSRSMEPPPPGRSGARREGGDVVRGAAYRRWARGRVRRAIRCRASGRGRGQSARAKRDAGDECLPASAGPALAVRDDLCVCSHLPVSTAWHPLAQGRSGHRIGRVALASGETRLCDRKCQARSGPAPSTTCMGRSIGPYSYEIGLVTPPRTPWPFELSPSAT